MSKPLENYNIIGAESPEMPPTVAGESTAGEVIPLAYIDIAPLLAVIRGGIIYGEGAAPEGIAHLGYTYAVGDCDGACVRIVNDGTVTIAAHALKHDGALQCASAITSTLAEKLGLYLIEVVGSQFIYRKN